MAYTRVNWVDLPATTTPVDAANLNIMDAGIAAAYVQGTGGLLNVDIGAGAAIAISKLADPGSGKVVGAGPTAVFPPGYEIAYAQITAPVNIVSTTEATGTTIISSGSIVFDGAAVMAEFFAPSVLTDTASAGDSVIISLFEATTQIGRLVLVQTPSVSAGQSISASGRLRFTPSAGAHTYTVTAKTSSTTGTPKVNAGLGSTGDYVAAFIRFTKV